MLNILSNIIHNYYRKMKILCSLGEKFFNNFFIVLNSFQHLEMYIVDDQKIFKITKKYNLYLKM